MSSDDPAPAFEGLLELLATNADPEQVLGFRLQEDYQRRLDDLLSKNRANTGEIRVLSPARRFRFLCFHHQGQTTIELALNLF